MEEVCAQLNISEIAKIAREVLRTQEDSTQREKILADGFLTLLDLVYLKSNESFDKR